MEQLDWKIGYCSSGQLLNPINLNFNRAVSIGWPIAIIKWTSSECSCYPVVIHYSSLLGNQWAAKINSHHQPDNLRGGKALLTVIKFRIVSVSSGSKVALQIYCHYCWFTRHMHGHVILFLLVPVTQKSQECRPNPQHVRLTVFYNTRMTCN